MARAPRVRGGIKIAVDTSELVEFAKKAGKVEKATKPALITGLNLLGDHLVSVLSRNLQKQSGLALEQVLGLLKVNRADPGDIAYEVTINRRLLEKDVKTLEGQREVREFGTKDPDTLVIIVSKEDELVCMECEILAASGPMSIEIAKQHIPAHPNCRCVIVPYVQPRRRLEVTMTSLTGTDPVRRAGVKPLPMPDTDVTIRQLAQSIADRTATNIRIQLQ